jgi:hypothetical protein
MTIGRRLGPLLLVVAAALGGCGAAQPGLGLTPATDAAESVNRTYNAEFEAALPAMRDDRFPPGSFAGTLAAIGQARSQDLSPELAARLDVREALIYLQTGELGRARAIAPEVAQAAVTLGSATGQLNRDAMIAEAWPALLQAEEALAALPDAPAGSAESQRAGVEIAPRLAVSGAALRNQLCAARRHGRLPAPGQDDGATVLAAYGSNYLSSADAIASSSCALNPAAGDLAICRAAEDRRYLREARDLIAAFLPPEPDPRFAELAARHRRTLEAAFAPAPPPAAADPCG